MAQAQEETGPRSFASFIEDAGGGRLNRDLSEANHELGRILQDVALDTGLKAKGELKIKLKYLCQPDGVVSVGYDIDVKRPKRETHPVHAWVNKQGNFQFEPPRQLVMTELTPVKGGRQLVDLNSERDKR